jgi:hypothetical protein
LVSKQLSFSYE